MQIKHENTALALEIAGSVAVDVLHCLKRDTVRLVANAWRSGAGWLDAELPFCLKRERDVLAADLAQMSRSRDDLSRELMSAVDTIGQLRTREAKLVAEAAQLTAAVEASRASALKLAAERDLWKAKAMAAMPDAPVASAVEAGERTAKPENAVEPGKSAKARRKTSETSKTSKTRKKVGKPAGAV
jgi:hypothetical protein